MSTRIAITGAAGRMGKTLLEAVRLVENATLGAAIERPASEAIGSDTGELIGMGHSKIVVVNNLQSQLDQFDVLIDFTVPTATVDNAQLCAEHGKQMVIGTTGMDLDQLSHIDQACQKTGIVMASNYSTGVNATFKLLSIAAKILGEEYDVEIIEAHHRHKVDSPSGTALSMGEAVADALGTTLREKAIYGREGQVGARPKGEIGFSTIRGGDVVGDHTVMFLADGERVEISHKASSRMSFARGAVRAATWIHSQSPGLYDMQDVLGLKD